MTRETIQSLIERVEGASGPDRLLDAQIWCALLHPENKASTSRPGFVAITDDEPSRWGYKEVEHYTSSLEAALSLVERVLPGWRPAFAQKENGDWIASIYSTARLGIIPHQIGDKPTPALALILALLKAKAAETAP